MSEQEIRIEREDDDLVIRSATMEDAEILTKWWNDGKIMAHAGFPRGLNQNIKETRRQIQENYKKLSQLCIIEVAKVKVGEMSFGIGEDFAEIGIKICDTDYQNRGLGTKLIQMLIDYIFNSKKINDRVFIKKIILDTNLNNTRAQHVYEKLGFKNISVNYNDWKDQLGNWQTSINYELSREQYDRIYYKLLNG